MQMCALNFVARIVMVALLCLGLATVAKAEIDFSCSPTVDEPDEARQLRKQASALYAKSKYAEAMRTRRDVATAIEKMETVRDGAPGRETAYALGDLSWNALLARAPAEALKASERAHTLVPCIVWTGEASRAHSLVLLGRIGEARTIYIGYKQKRISGTLTWEEKIADDLDELRAAGIIHQAFTTILSELGIKHLEQNTKIGAVRRKVEQLEKALGPVHPDLGTALSNLASLYLGQRRFAKANLIYQRSLDIRETALGPNDPDVATALADLATVYEAQRSYAGAEPLLQRSLAIRERALGPNHPDVGTSLDSLAWLYRKQTRYAEATPLFQRSLAIRESALGPAHLDLAKSLNDLAELYRDQGRYAEAEPLFKRSIIIREKAVGADHPDVGRSLHRLAELYQDQGRYAEVEPLLKRSLGIGQKALGPDHPDIGTLLNTLAALYRVQGRYAEAEPLFKRGIVIGEKALGSDHPDVGRSLSNWPSCIMIRAATPRPNHY
jgi:tetratricopeptide (TPR) repeat protein